MLSLNEVVFEESLSIDKNLSLRDICFFGDTFTDIETCDQKFDCESDIVKIWTLNFIFLHYTNILAYNVKL